MKSILLRVQDDDSLDIRLPTALSLTRATEGHLRRLHVTPIEAYMAMPRLGGSSAWNPLSASVIVQQLSWSRKWASHLAPIRATRSWCLLGRSCLADER